jgi:hypothetical protein
MKEMRNAYKFASETLKRRCYLGDLNVDSRILQLVLMSAVGIATGYALDRGVGV